MVEVASSLSSRAWNEMFEAPGVPRDLYAPLFRQLATLQPSELRQRADQLSRTFRDRGVTFAHAGEERPFPLDLIPRLIAAQEWDLLQRGIAQRVTALERFLDDVYGEGWLFQEGVIPRAVIVSSPHYCRPAHGVVAANGVRIMVSGIDLVRDENGAFRVLEDNVRIPSGVSYVIENRRAMTQNFATLFGEYRVQPVDEYPARLLNALRASAPASIDDPVIVVLSPGVHNAAYFEHVLLARMMGVELVEGPDLVCRANFVFMRTTQGERPVHVIYRRIDDEWLDPLQFRPDSVIGVAGLTNAARAGNVSLANNLGNGVADDKLVYSYVPDLIRFYLHEEPLLENVETFRLEGDSIRHDVLASLHDFVVKPVDGSGGKDILIGPLASEEELARAREAISESPRRWIAQRPVALSTHPTLVGEDLGSRHVDLRPFAVNDGREVWVLPGGLTRVALNEGELIVNSSKGGGSKDTWVLNARTGAEASVPPPKTVNAARHMSRGRQHDQLGHSESEQ